MLEVCTTSIFAAKPSCFYIYTTFFSIETSFKHQSGLISQSQTADTCDKPVVVPPGPRGDVLGWRAAEETQSWSENSLITETADGDEPEPGELSPEVSFLLRRPDHKGNVAVVSFRLPHLEGWSFQDVSVHHGDGADEAPSVGQVCHFICCPGRVLLPRDGLGGQNGERKERKRGVF